MNHDLLGIGIVVAITLVIAAIVHSSRLPDRVKLLIYAALALRYVGAFGREAIARDAGIYLRWGREYAEYFSRFDFSPLYDPTLWRSAKWAGTNFVGYPTGLIVSLVGPGKLAVFFAFGLLSFIGIWAFAKAYQRAYPNAPYYAYWAWIFLFPSLWFWPSSIGKEAIMIVGLGLATLGFAGRHDKMNWPVLLAGLWLVYTIRPPVAAIFVFAIMASHWLNFQGWTMARLGQAVVMLVLCLAGMYYALSAELGGEVRLDSLEAYVDDNAARNQGGGSSFEGVGATPTGIPQAVINVLFRPFPWEAHTLAALISAIEIWGMWALVYFRRHQISRVLRNWRRDRMLRFAIPFAVLYVVALGMNLSNLGLMARQRTLVFPFLFLIFEGGAAYLTRRRTEEEQVRTEEVAA